MQETYVIEGGRPLEGEVAVGGAKNSVLKLLAAALLAPGRHTLERVPRIADVDAMLDVLRHLGVRASWRDRNALEVEVPDVLGTEAPYELVSRMRASTAVLGPLLAREGRARVAMPGGCNLGPRPIDIHLRGLERLGAEIDVAHGYLEARVDRLRGATVHLDYPSHGATENLVMAAVLAEGRTRIENASREPEIIDLARFCERMGARITGAGTPVISVEGTSRLAGASHEVMPDRLEAGTYLFAAAATGGDVTVRGCEPEYLTIVLEKLREAGMELEVGDGQVRIVSEGRPRAMDVSTLPYPGFPTDLQPLAVALLARAPGLSIVTENIFDGRYMFIDELARMGADVRVEGHYAVIRGVDELTGAPVRASDLRAGAALCVAGLIARGETSVDGTEQIARGYEDLPGRLVRLGAAIESVPSRVGAATT